jgi:hypothetical protein
VYLRKNHLAQIIVVNERQKLHTGKYKITHDMNYDAGCTPTSLPVWDLENLKHLILLHSVYNAPLQLLGDVDRERKWRNERCNAITCNGLHIKAIYLLYYEPQLFQSSCGPRIIFAHFDRVM